MGVTWTSYTSPHVLGIVPLKIISDKAISYSFASIENFLISRARSIRNLLTQQKNLVCFLRSDTVRLSDSTSETFNERNEPELERSLKQFEITLQETFLVRCHPKILLL